MSARVRVALRDLVQLLSAVGLDVVEEGGDVDPLNLLAALPQPKTTPEAVRVGRSVPAVALPSGLQQVGVLVPHELWPDLVKELVEGRDLCANGYINIRLQLWNGQARHPEITRLFRPHSKPRTRLETA